MTGWNPEAFDRWLTTEPAETCFHAETECNDLACDCDCEHCEEFKANHEYDPNWAGTGFTETGTVHITDAVSRYPEGFTE